MMPKGPQGQKRPRDVVSNAVKVMRIATGHYPKTVLGPLPTVASIRFCSLTASSSGVSQLIQLYCRMSK